MAKRRCIASLLGHRHISMSEARFIIGMLGPEGCTEAEVRAAVDDFSSDIIDVVDIPAKAGGSWTWHIAKFQRLLPFVVSRCAGFRWELESALTHFPNSQSSPWHLVLYSDEVTPGNVLKLQNRRKAACWYLGIVEMMDFLRREEAWLTIGVIRASHVKKLHGGYSSVARVLLRSLLLGSDGVSSAGVPLHVLGSPRVLYFKFDKLLADEAMTKTIWDVTGHGGLKSCTLQCRNVVHYRRVDDEDGVALADMQEGDDLVDISCCDPDEFDPMTDADVWRSYDMVEAAAERLRARTISKKTFLQLSKALGFNLNPHGVLADKELRPFVAPTSATVRDSMHTLFSGGVMNIEIMALLNALEAADNLDFSWQIMRDLADAEWHWFPGRLGHGAMREVFSEGREAASKAAGIFKAGASETLQVYPLIRHFLIEHMPAACVAAQRASFLALCHVADLVREAKFHQTPEAVRENLKAALVHWRNAHDVAYGKDLLVPKHHFAFHLPTQAAIWLDCFTHERKNVVVKASMEFHHNASSFERGTLQQLLLMCVPQMDRVRMTELVGPSAEMHMLGQQWAIGRRLRFKGLMHCVGAIIFLGEAGQRAAEIQVLG